jgi:HEAT repeat protein
MRRLPPVLTLAVLAPLAAAGCKATPLPPDQLSVEDEEWILKVDEILRQYDKARKFGLIEDQRDAQHRLHRLAEEERALLDKALKCNDWRGRMIAAAALGYSSRDDVIQPLVDAMSDPSVLVQHHAMWGLAAHGSDQTPVAPLLSKLADPDADLRLMALGVLAHVLRRNQDRGAMPAVLEKLTDPDHRIRAQATLVLAKVARPDSVQILVEKMLKDDVAEVRRNAVGALFVIGVPEVVEPLVGALTDPDPQVADTAQKALEGLSGQTFGKDPDRWLFWWKKRKDLGLGLDH